MAHKKMLTKENYDAVIFDLDGVVTGDWTAPVWQLKTKDLKARSIHGRAEATEERKHNSFISILNQDGGFLTTHICSAMLMLP